MPYPARYPVGRGPVLRHVSGKNREGRALALRGRVTIEGQVSLALRGRVTLARDGPSRYGAVLRLRGTGPRATGARYD